MKALSIRQPWAGLIVTGVPIVQSVPAGDGLTRLELTNQRYFKDVENRAWPTDVRERFIVHASKRHDRSAMEYLMKKQLVPPMFALLGESSLIPHGTLIGEVDLVDCVRSHPSPWFVGPWGFVLANPEPYAEPVPYRGRLGFFNVESTKDPRK